MRVPKNIIDQPEILNHLTKIVKGSAELSARFSGESIRLALEHTSSVGALLTYYLTNAVRNTYLPTATSAKAVYLLAKSLGVKVRGKTPFIYEGILKVKDTFNLESWIIEHNLDSSSYYISLQLDKWMDRETSTEFHVENDILLDVRSKTSATINITQNALREMTFLGRNESYDYVTISSDYKANINDISVRVGDIDFIQVSSLLDKRSNIFTTEWDNNGAVVIRFGLKSLHRVPEISDKIVVRYKETLGAIDTRFEDQVLKILGIDENHPDNNFEIQVGRESRVGLDEESPANIKITSPRLYASNERAVRREDFKAHLNSIPEILFSDVWGEQEIDEETGSRNIKNMNMVNISLLGKKFNPRRVSIPQGLPIGKAVSHILGRILNGDIKTIINREGFSLSDYESYIQGSIYLKGTLKLGLQDQFNKETEWQEYYGEGVVITNPNANNYIGTTTKISDRTSVTLTEEFPIGRGNRVDRGLRDVIKIIRISQSDSNGDFYKDSNLAVNIDNTIINVELDSGRDPTRNDPIYLVVELNAFLSHGLTFKALDSSKYGFISEIGGIYLTDLHDNRVSSFDVLTTNFIKASKSRLYERSFKIQHPGSNLWSDPIPLDLTNFIDSTHFTNKKSETFAGDVNEFNLTLKGLSTQIPIRHEKTSNNVNTKSKGHVYIIGITGINEVAQRKRSFSFEIGITHPVGRISNWFSSSSDGNREPIFLPYYKFLNYGGDVSASAYRVASLWFGTFRMEFQYGNYDETLINIVRNKLRGLSSITQDFRFLSPRMRPLTIKTIITSDKTIESQDIVLKVRERVKEYINSRSKIKLTIHLSDLYNLIVSILGVKSCIIVYPVFDISPGLNENYFLDKEIYEVV